MINLGLIGWPVSHSISPLMHNAALKALGLQGEYRALPVLPHELRDFPDELRDLPDELATVMQRIRSGELLGVNVTIPHKQNVLPYLDDIAEDARIIGAVNTICMKDGKLTGFNTDAPGFLTDLTQKMLAAGHDVSAHGSALVLGAGGSARAVVRALSEAGWQVHIAARNLSQARDLVDHFTQACSTQSAITASLLDAKALLPQIARFRLVVNTTPVGMTPKTWFSPWPEGLALPGHAFLYDLIYNPAETLLIRQAKEAGLAASNGLGMLVEQAALAFEIWTGIRPPREVMVAAVPEFTNR